MRPWEQDGVNGVLRELIDRAALESFGKDIGIVASPALVGRELSKIPAFQGLDGKFSEANYRQVLQQRGFTDENVRNQFAQQIVTRQLLAPAMVGIQVPGSASLRYAQILTERRQGEIAVIPAIAFAPKVAPSAAELDAWYKGHSKDYLEPERRVIRYAVFDETAVKQAAVPTEAEIAKVYKDNAARYAASDTRSLTQLVLPTEAAAKAVLAEVSGGKSLDAAATAKGLTTAKLTKLSREALAVQTSKEVADKAFAGGKGQLIGPAKIGIGWALLRVEAAEGSAAKTLEQARPEIVAQLSETKRREAVTEFSAQIEDEFDNGSSLGDVAKNLGLSVAQTEPLLANGQVFDKPGVTAPAVLAKVLQTAFAMEGEGQPQLAEVEAGKTFVVFEVSTIAAAAPAPLEKVKARVAEDVMTAKGVNAARDAARKVEALVKKGTPLSAAMASLGVQLPPVQQIDMPRQQVQQMGQQVPPPLRLLFLAGKGAVKLLDAPRGRAWYVVHVKDVIPGQIAPNSPELTAFSREMRQTIGTEYADALAAAIRKDVGVKRDEKAIQALTARLKGGN